MAITNDKVNSTKYNCVCDQAITTIESSLPYKAVECLLHVSLASEAMERDNLSKLCRSLSSTQTVLHLTSLSIDMSTSFNYTL